MCYIGDQRNVRNRPALSSSQIIIDLKLTMVLEETSNQARSILAPSIVLLELVKAKKQLLVCIHFSGMLFTVNLVNSM